MSRTLLSLRSLTMNSIRMASTGMVKTPIPLFGKDGPYVTALWSAASKQKKLDAVDNELKVLLELSKKNAVFKDFLFNPLIKPKEKKNLVNKALPTLKLSEVTLNLIQVLAENGKLKLFPAVARGFNKVMSISKGEVECTVTTAKPIDDSTRKDIEQSLNGFVKGQKLSLTLVVNPDILGGMIVDFAGEHYIDMSIRSKFNFYSNLIKQAV